MAEQKPMGEERKVRNIGRVAIDGAPITYIIVLAAVVSVLAFIPFSVILAFGGSFPMSQGVYAVIGWILGPVAGAVASGVGALIGIFVAPQTAGIWFATLIGAVYTSFAAGSMSTQNAKRKFWWVGVAVISAVALVIYLGRALLIVGIQLQWVILTSFADWSALLLFILPTRTLVARWIGSKNIGLVALGLALGTWICYGNAHTVINAILFTMTSWPEKIWILLAPIIPVEFLCRCAIGAVIGAGVIAGLRAIGLVKPSEGIY
jgi:hypothetical protein